MLDVLRVNINRPVTANGKREVLCGGVAVGIGIAHGQDDDIVYVGTVAINFRNRESVVRVINVAGLSKQRERADISVLRANHNVVFGNGQYRTGRQSRPVIGAVDLNKPNGFLRARALGVLHGIAEGPGGHTVVGYPLKLFDVQLTGCRN